MFGKGVGAVVKHVSRVAVDVLPGDRASRRGCVVYVSRVDDESEICVGAVLALDKGGCNFRVVTDSGGATEAKAVDDAEG